VAWAAEAGCAANAGELAEVLADDPGPGPGAEAGAGGAPDLGADSGPVAENLFFRFLDRLGVVPL
ncbi:hypothetical protein ACFXA8_27610, partial [Streptomyces sp. NPDC059409]